MTRIIKIGMDVHSKSYSLHALEPVLMGEDIDWGSWKVAASPKNVLDAIATLKTKIPGDADIECGYEAGCLGFSLHDALVQAGVKCVVLAPTTMLSPQKKRIKTDARDAKMIAQCLAYGGYQPVHIPTEQDLDVKRFIRMRDDHVDACKRVKQQINSLLLSEGIHYEKTKWTKAHVDWLRKVDVTNGVREILDEYLLTYDQLTDHIQTLDQRIEEKARLEPYKERTEKLACFLGIKVLSGLKCLTEIGDFDRFDTAGAFASFPGLVPGEHSSGESQHRTGITKAGNSVVRKTLIEAAQTICKGRVGAKSKDLKSRQAKCDAATVAYADRGNIRMRRRYYSLICQGKPRNVAAAAVARELACFIWGMMTGHTD